MARKALAPATGGAVSTHVGSWDEELAKGARRAMKMADAVSSAGSWITFKGGIMAWKGMPIQGNSVECIVLNEGVRENLFYEGRFDPENPASPTCYAIAWKERPDSPYGAQLDDRHVLDTIAPYEASPEKQHETCDGCPQNKFGSSDTGKGKACKNVMRLALIAYNDTAEAIEKAELTFAKLPVTSVKNWGAYIKSLSVKANHPAFAYVTKMSVVPDPKAQFLVTFEAIEKVNSKLGPSILRRVQEAERQMVPSNPYEPMESSAPTVTKRQPRRSQLPPPEARTPPRAAKQPPPATRVAPQPAGTRAGRPKY